MHNLGFSYYTPWGPPPLPPPQNLYTGIYLPTFREGTNFIIKQLVSCLGALTGPRERHETDSFIIKLVPSRQVG